MSEFPHEYQNNNDGYDLTADFDQIGRYLADVNDGSTFEACVEEIMANYLGETKFQNQELFVASSLELDLPGDKIAYISRFGAREIAKPFVTLLDPSNKSYERFSLGENGALVKFPSFQLAEGYDESAGEEEARAHYLKLIKGEPLESGEADRLLDLLKKGKPRARE